MATGSPVASFRTSANSRHSWARGPSLPSIFRGKPTTISPTILSLHSFTISATAFSRFRLGRELEQKLEALLEEVPSPSEQDLMEAFGPAEEMTELLMRRVPQWQQRLWMRLKRSAVAALVVAVTVTVLLALAVFWIKENPL
jgi:hypothetical protein